jgi:hypothetical protein
LSNKITTIDMDNAYPNTDELLPNMLLAKVPASLVLDITRRYKEYGPKYMTDGFHIDGRQINACMQRNSIQDAIEEVVDAVFNVLVWIFKLSKDNSAYGQHAGQQATSALAGLVDIYTLLAIENSRVSS